MTDGMELAQRHCDEHTNKALVGGASARERMQALDGAWNLTPDGKAIVREFKFKDFHATMEFVNALAFIAHREDHHPDLEVGYNRCQVTYTNHKAGGLTESDLICAAKVDRLLD